MTFDVNTSAADFAATTIDFVAMNDAAHVIFAGLFGQAVQTVEVRKSMGGEVAQRLIDAGLNVEGFAGCTVRHATGLVEFA
jgi:hypothetical protein